MTQVFLLTGLSGAGKTTLAKEICRHIDKKPCVLLDGDEMRKGVCKDLGFSPDDREENIRRCGEIAKVLSSQGIVVILALIAPYQKARENLENIIGKDKFYTIHVDCPLEVCMQRDPKKNYRKAHAGLLKNYTGLGDPYEPPSHPDLTINTAFEHQDESLKKALDFVREKIWFY